jgi:hypothetical protein
VRRQAAITDDGGAGYSAYGKEAGADRTTDY